MYKPLNLKNFQTFTKQVKGARLGEISVSRADHPRGFRLKYTARDPKSRRVYNGEWVIPHAPAPADGPGVAEEKEFLALAGKEFVVHGPE